MSPGAEGGGLGYGCDDGGGYGGLSVREAAEGKGWHI